MNCDIRNDHEIHTGSNIPVLYLSLQPWPTFQLPRNGDNSGRAGSPEPAQDTDVFLSNSVPYCTGKNDKNYCFTAPITSRSISLQG